MRARIGESTVSASADTTTSMARFVSAFQPRIETSFNPISGMPLTVSTSTRLRLISYRSGTSLKLTRPLPAVVHDPQDRGVRGRWQRHDHLVDSLHVGEPFDVVKPPEVAEPPEVAARSSSTNPTTWYPRCRPRRQALHDDPAEVVAADHQHALHPDAAPVEQRRDEVDPRPPRDHERRRSSQVRMNVRREVAG